ncbi:hypothetical protein BST61_g11315 [Cercospora zeina]
MCLNRHMSIDPTGCPVCEPFRSVVVQQEILARRLISLANGRYRIRGTSEMSEDVESNLTRLMALAVQASAQRRRSFVPYPGSNEQRMNSLALFIGRLEAEAAQTVPDEQPRIVDLNERVNRVAESLGRPSRALNLAATPQEQIASIVARLIDFGAPDSYTNLTLDQAENELVWLINSGRGRGTARDIAEQTQQIRVVGDRVRVGGADFDIVPRESLSQDFCYVCSEGWDNLRHLPAQLRCGHGLCSSCIAVLTFQNGRCPQCRGVII